MGVGLQQIYKAGGAGKFVLALKYFLNYQFKPHEKPYGIKD